MAKNVKPALPFLSQEFTNLQDEVGNSVLSCTVLKYSLVYRNLSGCGVRCNDFIVPLFQDDWM